MDIIDWELGEYGFEWREGQGPRLVVRKDELK